MARRQQDRRAAHACRQFRNADHRAVKVSAPMATPRTFRPGLCGCILPACRCRSLGRIEGAGATRTAHAAQRVGRGDQPATRSSARGGDDGAILPADGMRGSPAPGQRPSAAMARERMATARPCRHAEEMPLRDVAGLDRPRSDRMNSAPTTRYNTEARLASSQVPRCFVTRGARRSLHILW